MILVTPACPTAPSVLPLSSLGTPSRACRRFWIAGTLGLVLMVLLGSGCNRPASLPDHFTWTNPVTGAAVKLPEGWRHSPDTARRGETTVGYFTPTFAGVWGQYGNVTLHHEDLRGAAAQPSLERFVDSFVAYLQSPSARISEPVAEEHLGQRIIRLSAEMVHRDQAVRLRVRFWNPDGAQYWYAVVESRAEDGEFAERAAPLVDLLQASTAPPVGR